LNREIFASEMKLAAGSILILLMMVQTFTAWLIIAEYAINKDYIAKNLCINKEKPNLHCNGKCRLMKKLSEEENKNSPTDPSTGGKIKMSETVFLHETQFLPIRFLFEEPVRFNSVFILKKTANPSADVFRPPCV
jgi:hypothetical protein